MVDEASVEIGTFAIIPQALGACGIFYRRLNMLDEKAIDKLIQPLIDRQTQIEMTVIEKIARRLGEIKTYSLRMCISLKHC